MKRSVVVTGVVVMLFAMCVWTLDAWARAGGGKGSGSRGSRSSSSPASHDTAPSSMNRQAVPPAAVQPAMPQRSGWMGGLMGGIAGFALGGLIGSMLFGGFGGSFLGGMGLLEIVLIGGLLYAAFAYMRRRQPAPAGSYGYGTPQGTATPSWQAEPTYASTATMGAGVAESDIEQGIRHIRQMDSSFDPDRFAETASDLFFKVQAAWTVRDLDTVRSVVTQEMYNVLQEECNTLRAARRINRLENIAMRTVRLTEAWQESGQDFVTVYVLASLLDYTVEEASNQVVAGSRTEPVKFEEYWTFVRPVGPHPWQLSAIQQAV